MAMGTGLKGYFKNANMLDMKALASLQAKAVVVTIHNQIALKFSKDKIKSF